MTTQTATTDTKPMFTAAERRGLRALRERYRQDRDLFSERELNQLRFIRWLSENGHLDS